MNRNIFPNAPLTFDEMVLLIPEKVRESGERRALFLTSLFRKMERHLEDARMVSRMPIQERGYRLRTDLEMPIRIRRIQEQMSAIRFRLDIHDYSGGLEREILCDRLYYLYDQARIVDPGGVGRFERMMDKKMRKARLR